MSNDLHLKRFFIETYNDVNMYYDYLQGKLYLDLDKYNKWHKEMKYRNARFAEYVDFYKKNTGYSNIVETAISEGLTVSENFVINSCVTTSAFGAFPIKEHEKTNERHLYICNGYFKDTLEQIYRVLDSGAFTVGICCEKKTDLFRDVVAHYNKTRDFLLREGYVTSCIESNVNSKNRIYLLSYNSFSKKRIK